MVFAQVDPLGAVVGFRGGGLAVVPAAGASVVPTRIGMIAARAIVLARDLRARGLTVTEAYRRAVGTWLQHEATESTWEGGYEGLADALRTTGLLAVVPSIDLNAVEPDALDAFLCVLVGIAYFRVDRPAALRLDEERDRWIRVPTGKTVGPERLNRLLGLVHLADQSGLLARARRS